MIETTGAHVKFTVPAVGGTYEGDLKDGQIVGNWTQGPGTLPLTFKRRQNRAETAQTALVIFA